MKIKYPKNNIEKWISENENLLQSFTSSRIKQSYHRIPGIMTRLKNNESKMGYDVCYGSGFDSFALSQYFDKITAFNISSKAIKEARLIKKSTTTARGGGL